jgi:hypothetical protein
VARTWYLASASGLICIPKLQGSHGGEKIGFGSSALTAFSETLVRIGLANQSDWINAKKLPSTLVDAVLRRFLADHGQTTIAEHFELCLTLGQSIIDSVYGEPDQAAAGQLFLVLNTESSFALGIGHIIEQLQSADAGLGEAFYDSLRQSLYRWVRVYDDGDARERIEQMAEWAEGEDDPDSYEIPKLDPDLPACLRNRKFTDRGQPLASFSLPPSPQLKKVVELAIELEHVSQSVERPKIDEGLLERERDHHSLDSPLPAILLYFRPGDAVMACFDNECEFWGQETPEPNLIVPFWPDDPDSVRQALAVIETLMRALVLAVEIKQLAEPAEGTECASVSMLEANSN